MKSPVTRQKYIGRIDKFFDFLGLEGISDVGGTNIAVGSNDPNNLDGDNDGIGCETEEGNDDQTNNDDEEEPETDDETTREILEGIDGTVIGETTGDSSE